MINRTHALPVVRQCQVLELSRSTAYYQPTSVSTADLGLMRRIDALHLDYPFAGARMLRDLLRREGHAIGRRHVATLMRRMGIEAVYRKPRTSQRHPAHRVYPYLLRHLEITRPNHVWAGCQHTLHSRVSVKRPVRTDLVVERQVARHALLGCADGLVGV